MPDRVIENPILNSPYREPSRHFVFDDDGITNEIAEGRRRSAYFIPIPRPRKQAARQLELVTEWTLDRIRENREINEVRGKVQLWRRRGYPDVTPTTRALLDYWNATERDNPILFCQREAAETAIYLTEAAPKSGDAWIRNELEAANAEHNNSLPRIDIFLNYWLVMRRTREVPADRIFTEFRDYVGEPGRDLLSAVRELAASAEVYELLESMPWTSPEGTFAYRALAVMDAYAFGPFLLWLFGQPETVVSSEQREAALAAIESWLVRRMLCRLAPRATTGWSSSCSSAPGARDRRR